MDGPQPPHPDPPLRPKRSGQYGGEGGVLRGTDLHLAEAKVLMRWRFWQQMGLALVMNDR
jgi:hypothetical protein